MMQSSEINPLNELKFPTFGRWVLFHGLFFSALGLVDWHFDETFLPKNHGLLTLPMGLGLLQGYLLRNCLKKSYLLMVVNPLGIAVSFVGMWIFPALIGFGFGLVHAIFWWLQGYRRTFILILGGFAGWILGAEVWSFLPGQENLPEIVKIITEPLAQPVMGAGLGYAICTYLAIWMLKRPAR